ncbi:MAG: glycine cleavage system protein GcvH [Candidatus Dormibacteria bacterium]
MSGYRFSPTHEWVAVEGREATVGITDHAQSQLGDVIFVELPSLGEHLTAGQRFGVVESVKAASDLYAPVGGRVVAVNELLAENPQAVNDDAFGEGWLIRLSEIKENDKLLDEAAYGALVGE